MYMIELVIYFSEISDIVVVESCKEVMLWFVKEFIDYIN